MPSRNMSSKIFLHESSQWSDLEIISMDLCTAASVGCEERVREIINNSAVSEDVINRRNRDGWAALMYAAYSGDPNVVKFLLQKGASSSVRDRKGLTSLMLAANCGNTDSASLLIDAGADVNARDNQNWTALFYATSTGHRSVVQLLVEKGARINIMEERDGMTPLMLASSAGHEMIVKDLLQYGASISISSKKGDTARSLAVRNGHTKVKSAIDAYLFLQRNYPSVPPSVDNSKESHKKSDVRSLLESLGLSKYYPVFQSHGIDLSMFWTLTDTELKEIGIELLGPRKKIAMAISRYKTSKPNGNTPDAHLLIEKLLEERKSLQQKISEMTKMLGQEESLRVSTELQLSESIQVLQNFTEKVNKTASQIIQLEEGLRTVMYNLKQVLTACSTNIPAMDNKTTCELKLSSAISMVNLMDNMLDDIHRRTLMLV